MTTELKPVDLVEFIEILEALPYGDPVPGAKPVGGGKTFFLALSEGKQLVYYSGAAIDSPKYCEAVSSLHRVLCDGERVKL